MDANQIDQFLALNSENLPAEKINELRELLADADDNKANLLNAISLKSKTTMLLISILTPCVFVHGVDRLMLGDTTNGIIKLLTCGGCWIWTIIDWFKIGDMTKDYNYKKIMEVLG